MWRDELKERLLPEEASKSAINKAFEEICNLLIAGQTGLSMLSDAVSFDRVDRRTARSYDFGKIIVENSIVDNAGTKILNLDTLKASLQARLAAVMIENKLSVYDMQQCQIGLNAPLDCYAKLYKEIGRIDVLIDSSTPEDESAPRLGR